MTCSLPGDNVMLPLFSSTVMSLRVGCLGVLGLPDGDCRVLGGLELVEEDCGALRVLRTLEGASGTLASWARAR